jgi:hypothetical protein
MSKKSVHDVWRLAQDQNLNDEQFKELLIKEGIIIKKIVSVCLFKYDCNYKGEGNQCLASISCDLKQTAP